MTKGLKDYGRGSPNLRSPVVIALQIYSVAISVSDFGLVICFIMFFIGLNENSLLLSLLGKHFLKVIKPPLRSFRVSASQ